jgi:hypothetical protein
VLLKSNAADEGRSYIRRALQLNERVGGLNATEKQDAQRLMDSELRDAP